MAFLVVVVGSCACKGGAAIGSIDVIGNLGGLVGPTLFGTLVEKKQYATGLYVLSVLPLPSVATILVVGHLRRDRLRAARAAARKQRRGGALSTHAGTAEGAACRYGTPGRSPSASSSST